VAIPSSLANASYRQASAKFIRSLATAKREAFVAGQRLARAVQAKGLGTLVSEVQTAALSRDAYQARIRAEAEKNRAAILLLAQAEYGKALSASKKASIAADAQQQRVYIEQAARNTEKGNILDMAAQKAYEAGLNVPEPDVVSYRRMQDLSTRIGIDFSSDPRKQYEVPLHNGLINPKLVNPLVDWLYPAATKRAAAAVSLRGLSGVGDVTPSGEAQTADWLTQLKAAFGVGVASAGAAALNAGQDQAKNNPGAAAAISAAGGVLNSIAATLGIQMNAGYQQGSQVTPEGEAKFPWLAIAGVLAAGGAGVLLWRHLK
jgi:hypothetical protein